MPVSLAVNSKLGVVSLVAGDTWLEIDREGRVTSTVNDDIVCKPLLAANPAESTKLIVQSEYVPSASVLCTVMVCSPLDPMLVGVAEEHDPPYVAVPASLTVILKLGVASFVLEATCCETEREG